ncbi:MAG TPA: hypothetical protein VFL12_08950 [Thermoanaerobaculia bacterium]|nr:hypothetical protein [Thermoanaerobaculia bacterium]
MARSTLRRSRRVRVALTFAAGLVVVLLVVMDVRLRSTGLLRTILWSCGVAVYALLLGAAAGPVIDYRDRPASHASESDTRADAAVRSVSR